MAGNNTLHYTGNLRSRWVFFSFILSKSQSKLGNFTCKGQGSWKRKSSSSHVAHVAARAPGVNPARLLITDRKWWQTGDQNSARVAKNKARSSTPWLCSTWRLRSSVRGETGAATQDGTGLAPTCLFLDLALSKPCANTQHSTAEATHGSRQVQMATSVLSHTGRTGGELRWGEG